jgi:hypothetical protein
VPKKRARPRKQAKPSSLKLTAADLEAAREVVDAFMDETVQKISAAVKERVQALVDVNEELAEAVDILHERVEELETRQGIFQPRPQATFCDCENCRLRWN